MNRDTNAGTPIVSSVAPMFSAWKGARAVEFYKFTLLSFVLALSVHAAGQDVIPHRQDRLPNRPFSPEEAVEAMSVPEGFAVELVASEPDIVNPIAMTFDDRGRVWVTESLEYPRKEPGAGRDRVKVLADTDGDGRADKFTVFADGLNIPTGVAVGYGGVWVLNAPDLLFLVDTDGDGRADKTEVVVTGFGRADTHELPSTLTWGPDGWLYGLNGVFNPSVINSHGKEYRFTCAMWRVHPRTREFRVVCEGTSNPYGIAWDPEGAAIVEACHWANDHMFHFVETGYYKRQAGAYPPYAIRMGSITDHGHQKTAYCGLAYFDSDAYPAKYRDRLYTGNIHGGCINADRLTRDGSTYVARAEPDFLNANDAWFMPVALKVGPDGCLYVLDWYDRYHCYQDANRDPQGIDRLKGRLYRVRYKDSPRAPTFDLAGESDEVLIRRLASPNIYFRESAQRLLTERDTPSIRDRLQTLLLDDSAPPKARMHGLWALVGTGLPGVGCSCRRGLRQGNARDTGQGRRAGEGPIPRCPTSGRHRREEGRGAGCIGGSGRSPVLLRRGQAHTGDRLAQPPPPLGGSRETVRQARPARRSWDRACSGETSAEGRRSHPGRARRGPRRRPCGHRAGREKGRQARPGMPLGRLGQGRGVAR
jgi:glucose/arabinose dehydrogenase